MKGLNFIFIFVISYARGVTIDQDLTLTIFQKSALDKFKNMVEPYLPHDYMKEEIYLIRFLRARDFNVPAAREMLMNNLEWRKESNMDNILKEDWSGFEQDYSHLIHGTDKEGRPIIITSIGSWDIRSAMLTGQRHKLMRFMDKGLEEMTSIIRKFQTEKKNVTQYYHIYDLSSFSIIQHACPQCVATLIYAMTSYESHYPGAAHKVVMVNTPAIFQPLLQTLKLAMTPLSAELFHVFGRNKNEYQTYLLKDISKSELPRQLGGTFDPE